MLEALNFMSIEQRIEYNVYIMIFKMINELSPKYLTDNIKYVNNVNISTRQRGNLYIKKCKTSGEQKTIVHKRFSMYNRLPVEIKNEKELHKFRKMLVQYIKSSEREELEIK